MKNRIVLLILTLFIPFCINAEELLTDAVVNSTDGKSEFVANESVNEDKNVNGIFAAAGNDVVINGYSEYGVFTGNNVNIKSTIEKDLFVAGNVVNIDINALRDSYIAGKTIDLSGNYERNVYIAGETITLSNITIKGNLKLGCTNLIIKDNVVINNIKYNSDCNITNLENASINNKETYDSKINIDEEVSESESIFSSISDFIISTLSLILVAFLINYLFPKIYTKLDKKISFGNLVEKTFFGLMLLFVIPLAAIFSMFTVIAIPAAVIVLIAYGIVCYIGKLTIISIIGNNIYKEVFKNKKDNSYLSILIGIVLYKLISLIPVIGTFVVIVSLLIGFAYTSELIFKKKN